MNVSKKQILEFAQTNQKVNASSLAAAYGMKAVILQNELLSEIKHRFIAETFEPFETIVGIGL